MIFFYQVRLSWVQSSQHNKTMVVIGPKLAQLVMEGNTCKMMFGTGNYLREEGLLQNEKFMGPKHN